LIAFALIAGLYSLAAIGYWIAIKNVGKGKPGW
jgi:hypothetical protein